MYNYVRMEKIKEGGLLNREELINKICYWVNIKSKGC